MEVQEMVLEIKYVREIKYKVELKKVDVQKIRYTEKTAKMKYKEKFAEKTVKIKHKEKTENLKDKEKMITYKKVIGAPDHHPGQHQTLISQLIRIS